MSTKCKSPECLTRDELCELVQLQRENIVKGEEDRHVLQAEIAKLEHDLKVATEMIVDLNSVIDTYVKILKRVY